MLKGNLTMWSKQRWNIKKWTFGNLMSLTFLNEEVEEFTSMWSKNLFNLRYSSYMKEKTFEYCL